MHRLFASLAVAVLSSSTAFAGPLVIWLEPDVPEARELRRAESDAGEATHLAHLDLAYPPQAATEQDEAAYDALRAELVDARARWHEWDVELSMAEELTDALQDITVIRSDRDRRDVVDAWLMAGAAASRAFPPSEFGTMEAAAPYRMDAPGGPINRAWYTALALDPDRTFARSDIADGAPFDDFAVVQRRAREFPVGTIDLSPVPDGAQVFVDGTFVGTGTAAVDLRPGPHYFHVVRGGRISGRSVVDVEAGRTVKAPQVVDDDELARARQAFLDGSPGAFPEDVKTALDSLQRAYRAGVFIAAVDPDGKVEIRPYRGVELQGRRLVTVVGAGDIGLGAVASTLFDDANGETTTAPGAQGGLSLELGISHVALLGGFDAALLPTETITYGNADQTENRSTSILPQPWGGVGLYVLRPNKARTTLLFAGTYGLISPGHVAPGGRLVLGLPIDDQGTWFRLTVGGAHAGDVIESWRDVTPPDTSMTLLYARLGVAARF